MRAIEATLLMAQVRQRQHHLAKKHLPRFLKKCLKLIKKTSQDCRNQVQFTYTPWFFYGHDYYWDRLLELVSSELKSLGYSISGSRNCIREYGFIEIYISWDAPPPSRI